ncbi:MAG: tyrosine-protein phosphatase [Candidatus Limnocylindrales bacterium]
MSGRLRDSDAPVFDLPNLRDVGGAPAADGMRVRRGLVFRSPALARATPRDMAALADLGLRTVVDLRSEGEREREPEAHLIPPGAAYRVADVNGGGVVHSPMWQLTVLRTPAERRAAFAEGRAEAGFEAKFRDFVTGQRPRRAFGLLLALLAAPEGLPAVFHCSTGKDRTGWAAAVLLTYLGVPEDRVLDDFLAGNDAIGELMRPALERHVVEGGDAHDLDPLVAARASYLRAGLHEVARVHGTMGVYVEEWLGLGAASGERLREALLELGG